MYFVETQLYSFPIRKRRSEKMLTVQAKLHRANRTGIICKYYLSIKGWRLRQQKYRVHPRIDGIPVNDRRENIPAERLLKVFELLLQFCSNNYVLKIPGKEISSLNYQWNRIISSTFQWICPNILEPIPQETTTITPSPHHPFLSLVTGHWTLQLSSR